METRDTGYYIGRIFKLASLIDDHLWLQLITLSLYETVANRGKFFKLSKNSRLLVERLCSAYQTPVNKPLIDLILEYLSKV